MCKRACRLLEKYMATQHSRTELARLVMGAIFLVIIKYKLLCTYKEEGEKHTIIHDLYFFQLWVPMLLQHQVKSIVANFSEWV